MKRTMNYGKVKVVQSGNYQFSVLDNEGNIIVPCGKYSWISGFDNGLARVKSFKGLDEYNPKTGLAENPKWGIIDLKGNEVLPAIYDEIWNFEGKCRNSTKVVKDGQNFEFRFDTLELQTYSPKGLRTVYSIDDNYESNSWDNYGTTYGKYAGSYAQDVMGYSDDVIDDAFDGDPDAYWNID